MGMHRGLVAFVASVALTATACERADAQPFSAPVGDADTATLDVVGGADAITVRSEDLGDDLYRVSTSDASVAARVERDHGTVRVRLVDDDEVDDGEVDGADRNDDREADRPRRPWGDDDPNDRWSEGRDDREDEADGVDDVDGVDDARIEIRLNSRVRWTLRLAGGADAANIDMSAGELAGVEFAAGVSQIRLSLPMPDGTVVVRMLAGASEFDLTAPPGVPARVRLGSGAGSVTVDGSTRTGVAQGTVLAPPSWESASDRYDIDAIAGVSRLTLARH
jgi:hypothetical protein